MDLFGILFSCYLLVKQKHRYCIKFVDANVTSLFLAQFIVLIISASNIVGLQCSYPR